MRDFGLRLLVLTTGALVVAMVEQIVARLYLAEFPHTVRHLAFPQAGHGIAAPPGEPTTGVAERLGGTASGNAAARAWGWRAAVEHLAASLGAS